MENNPLSIPSGHFSVCACSLVVVIEVLVRVAATRWNHGPSRAHGDYKPGTIVLLLVLHGLLLPGHCANFGLSELPAGRQFRSRRFSRELITTEIEWEWA